VVEVTVNGQVFALLPALDGAYLAIQINGNFLPRVQSILPVLETSRRNQHRLEFRP